MAYCAEAWESLRGDPLPWLLDSNRPHLHWRVLVDLVRRPPDSPAVTRARGGANAAEPIASLLRDLHPDGTWTGDASLWKAYSGSAWRDVTAVQWGADPTDPRLQAAAEVLLESSTGEGGFSPSKGGRAVPRMTARLLCALGELGWCRHPRFQEALAWFEEGDLQHDAGGWRATSRGLENEECAVTAVSLLRVLTACGDHRRHALRDRAVGSLIRIVGAAGRAPSPLGHPCLGRTDDAEIVSTLARALVPFDPKIVGAVSHLQRRQLEGGRWRRGIPVPKSLPTAVDGDLGDPSRWVTLKCVVALMAYAVEAGLPRMYPQKPS